MRVPFAWSAVAVAFTFVLSGCLDAGSDSNRAQGQARLGKGTVGGGAGFLPDWAELVFTFDLDHDHRDVFQHGNLSTPNFQLLGHNPLITDYHGKTAGGYFCGAVREGAERTLSIVHSWVSDVAFLVIDVTDPANPQKIGEFVLANTHVYDLALTQDQKTVLLATSPGTNSIGPDPGGTEAQASTVATFRDACTGEERPVLGPEQGLPFASGIIVVDITNPRVPAITDFRFFPVNGGHSVQTENVDGRPLVLVSVPNGGIPLVGGAIPGGTIPLPSGANSYYVIGELIDGPQGRLFNILSVYNFAGRPSPVPQAPQLDWFGGMHDGFIHKHPGNGKWYGYLAYGSSSLVIIDLTDPRNPEFVDHWDDWAGSVGSWAPTTPFVHEALPMDELWDGRHYTFIGEECGGRRSMTPTCLVAVLDTTDPADIQFVGAWTFPVETGGWSGAMYSPHYLAVQNRTLFITAYHAGVWAIDVSTAEKLESMPSIGVFMPAIPSPKPVGRQVPYDFMPVVLDALPLSDGSMIVYDGMTGIYTVRFDASNPGPSPEPWPKEGLEAS